MSTHSIALQQTIFNTLDGDSTLQSLVSDVFNFVPQNTAYPYVQIGDDSLSDNSTKDLDGNIHSIVIHTWSRYRGDKEAK